MKIYKIVILLLFIYFNNYSQSITNWNHYYASSGFIDLGNEIAINGGSELVLQNKATNTFTRIPYPAEIRNRNFHLGNCTPEIRNGPSNSVIVKMNGNCYGFNFLLVGNTFIPFQNFLGYNTDSLYFLKTTINGEYFKLKNSSNIYFYNNSNIIQVDSNADYINQNCYHTYFSENGNICALGDYKISFYQNNNWISFDTTYFGISNHIYNYGASYSKNGNFSCYFPWTDELAIYNHDSINWKIINIPSNMRHSIDTNAPIYYTVIDTSKNVWLMGDSLFCKYDGLQFIDLFNINNSPNYSIGNIYPPMYSNNEIVINYNYPYSKYIFNVNTNQYSLYPTDPKNVLPFNTCFPIKRDLSNNIWIGTMKSGVENYLVKKSSNNIWTVPDISLNQTSDGTSAIINDTGGAIIAGFGSPNYPFRLKDTICSPLYINGASTVGLSAIAIDQNNHYWTNGTNYNLFEYDGTLIQHSSPTSSPIKFIVVDSSNNKWIYFYNGKLYLYNGTFSTMYDSGNTGLNLDSLSNLIADPYSNAIWLCSEDGFLKLENGAWSTIDTSNSPIPTNDAEYIYFNSDSSILFGCRGGLAYLKNGIWEIYTVYNSLLCNNDVEGITVDQNCRMWLTTENGVSSAMLECGILNINLVSGKVTTPNNIPAQNLLMKLFKLDYTKNEIFQIENTFTDTFGNYSFELQDSGTYYVLAQTGNNSYNDFIPTYNNNESLIQLSSPFYYSSDGNIIKDIILNSKNEIIGICSISGRFTSSNSNIVLGNRIAFLVKNNQIIDSKITDIYGGFSFKNIPQGIYQIWLDKYGLSNFKSNNINVDCNNLNSYIFNIDSNGISGTPTSVNTQVNENDLLVFPNPNFGILNILYKNNTDSKFQILNIQGQIIYEIKLPKESQNKMINIEHTAKGVYFYKQICNNEFIKNGKLLIE